MAIHTPGQSRSQPHAVLIALLCAMAAPISACTSVKPELGKPYPAEDPTVAALDVHVFRETNHLRMTNTSGMAFGPCIVWVNAAYAYPINGFAINQRVDLPLGEFRNQYGQPFRAGGFFATELPTALVKAEIADDQGRYGLTVVRDEVD